jgi:hypothetical protein
MVEAAIPETGACKPMRESGVREGRTRKMIAADKMITAEMRGSDHAAAMHPASHATSVHPASHATAVHPTSHATAMHPTSHPPTAATERR